MTTFEVVGSIKNVEVIAVNHSIRVLDFLRRTYGRGRRRKLKGTATVRLEDGTIRPAEVHWCEAHGVGKRQMKIKKYPD